MTRVTPVLGLSLMASPLTVGCSASPTPSAPSSVGAALSVAIPASPLHAGDAQRFKVQVVVTEAVSTLTLDFGDGTVATRAPASSSLEVSHVYRSPGTYNATAVATTGSRTLQAAVVVRIEP